MIGPLSSSTFSGPARTSAPNLQSLHQMLARSDTISNWPSYSLAIKSGLRERRKKETLALLRNRMIVRSQET